MMHPALLDRGDLAVTEDDFVTSFNRRVFVRLREVIAEGMTPDISLFSSRFSPEEMGRIVEILNKSVGGDVACREMQNCINRLREEKTRKAALESVGSDSEDWATKIQEIRQTKRGDKKV